MPPCHCSGHLPASLCREKHDRLIVGGVLGSNAAWLLEHASEEVVMSALPWALRAAFEQCACAPLASLALNLGFVTLTLMLP
jgi:hypothetical protein